MAVSRPWITASDVKAYSDDPAIAERSDAKIAVDITRAEALIIKYCHHDFSDAEKYSSLPENVRVATILLTEAIAHNSYASTVAYSKYKSESLDDYSYTAGDATAVSIEDLGLSSLLDEYVENKPKGDTIFRIRKL